MKSPFPLLFAGAALVTSCSSPAMSSDLCEPAPRTQAGGALPIGRVWSGVQVAFGSALSKDGVLVAAFYDADRYLTLATYDPGSGRICRKRLPSRFAGWDAHNALVVAIDDEDRLHVAGNMHASPLVYATGPLDDLDAVALRPMLGRNEASATYPQFLRDGAGNLLFLYRDGMSGNGLWMLNAWRDGQWRRVGQLFAGRDDDGPVSAYPTKFVADDDGRFHVAVVWRRTPDVATNFALTYASTRDFQHWDVGGRTVNGPLSPKTMEMIDAPGVGQGLVNNAQLTLSPSGRPVVLFTKYVEGGKSGVVAAARDDGRWRTRTIVTGTEALKVSGGGSMPGLPIFRFAETRRDGSIHVSAVIGKQQSELLLDPTRLVAAPWRSDPNPGPVKRARVPNPAALGLTPPAGMEKVGVQSAMVRRNGVDGAVAGELRWIAQGVNQDQPRACKPSAPVACKPPASPLIWVPAPD